MFNFKVVISYEVKDSGGVARNEIPVSGEYSREYSIIIQKLDELRMLLKNKNISLYNEMQCLSHIDNFIDDLKEQSCYRVNEEIVEQALVAARKFAKSDEVFVEIVVSTKENPGHLRSTEEFFHKRHMAMKLSRIINNFINISVLQFQEPK